jgi:hypothetical protein
MSRNPNITMDMILSNLINPGLGVG